MKNKKTLNLISTILGGIGFLSALQVLPIVPETYSIAIIGFSTLLTPLFIGIGDFLDNKKFDGSYTGK